MQGQTSGKAEWIGPYRIEERLGAGSMGAVYRVYHPGLDARYALKVIRPDKADPGTLSRFRREIELLAQVSDDPGVVRIHTAAEERGRIYYVMDLVAGEDLQARLERQRFDAEPAAEIVRDVAQSVAAVHRRGIVHRDLKPGNVLIDEAGRPRLTDFGLARALGDDNGRLTRTQELIGTPYYMAPEQAFGGKHGVGPPADVYALGMILFALQAGEPAPAGSTALQVIDNVRHGRLRTLRSLAPAAPRELEELCQRCFALDPGLRPEAAELADELEAYLRGEAPAVRASWPVGVAAAVLTFSLVLAGLLLAFGWNRGEPPPAWAELPALAAYVSQAEGAGQAPALEEVRQRRAWLEGQQEPERAALVVRLLALEGWSQLDAGDRAGAAATLERAEVLAAAAPPSRELRQLERTALGALRGGLLAQAGAAGSGGDGSALLKALRDLERAQEAYPGREVLVRWHLTLALLADRLQDAAADLRQLDDPERVPAVERARIALADDRLPDALELIEGQPPGPLVARVRYAAGLAALQERDYPRALLHLEPAVAADPEGLERSEALRIARRELDRAASWDLSQPRRLLALSIEAETRVARLVRVLDPAFTLPKARVDEIYSALAQVGQDLKGDSIQLVRDLLVAAPDDVAVYKIFARLAVDYGLPGGDADIALIRQGVAAAEHLADREQLLKELAHGLYDQGRVPELLELCQELRDDTSLPARLKAYTLARAGDALRYVENDFDAARAYLDEAAGQGVALKELALFDYAYYRNRFEQAQRPADLQQARVAGWRYLEAYAGEPVWLSWIPGLCTWLSNDAVSLRRPDLAVRALDPLIRYHPERLVWSARRIAIRAAMNEGAVSAAELRRDFEQLARTLEDAIGHHQSRAQALPPELAAQRLAWVKGLRAIELEPYLELVDDPNRRPLLAALHQLEARLTPLGPTD